jgi:ATP-dependent Clp protease ATP-binding subunit ClpC
MFEKYANNARMAIFHARKETSHFGTPQIESEHLLLGLLTADKSIFGRYVCGVTPTETEIREAVVRATGVRPPIPTSIDLPLSRECRNILKYSAEEAKKLGHELVETEHLLLGILRESRCFAARLLTNRSIDLQLLRLVVAVNSWPKGRRDELSL